MCYPRALENPNIIRLFSFIFEGFPLYYEVLSRGLENGVLKMPPNHTARLGMTEKEFTGDKFYT